MAEEEKAATSAVNAASELVKTAMELLQLREAKPAETRGGPLVMVGRLYVSLTLILAAVTSASAFLDISHTPTPTVDCLRKTVLLSVGAGLVLGVALIVVLFLKHPMYLFSPTELSEATQQHLVTPPIKGKAGAPGPKP